MSFNKMFLVFISLMLLYALVSFISSEVGLRMMPLLLLIYGIILNASTKSVSKTLRIVSYISLNLYAFLVMMLTLFPASVDSLSDVVWFRLLASFILVFYFIMIITLSMLLGKKTSQNNTR